MLFEESDIKFENLNPNEFEELCFDLLTQFGFESLIWRQGGADSGRDIEAQYTISNPLVGNYKERWFVECKLYNQGVPVNEISSKIYWAEAERPQHLVIIVSSYLSQSAREWLEKRTASVQFRTHLIEGKQLKQLILGCTDIVEKYFIDKNCKLLKDAIQNWFSHGLLPDINIMYLFYQKIDKEKLTIPELAFLWSAWLMQYHEIEESAKI